MGYTEHANGVKLQYKAKLTLHASSPKFILIQTDLWRQLEYCWMLGELQSITFRQGTPSSCMVIVSYAVLFRWFGWMQGTDLCKVVGFFAKTWKKKEKL